MKPYLIPSVRLLWWVALLGVPAAVAFGLLPGAQMISAIVLVLLLAVVAVDAGISWGLHQGLEVQEGGVARLGINREDVIALPVCWLGRGDLSVKLALALPRELYSKVEWVEALLPSGPIWRRVDYGCVPLRRGSCK